MKELRVCDLSAKELAHLLDEAPNRKEALILADLVPLVSEDEFGLFGFVEGLSVSDSVEVILRKAAS